MPNLNKKRIIILGGGAVGSSIAASLSNNSEIDTILIARKKHIEKINENGLELIGKVNDIFRNIKTTEKLDFELNETDFLLITVKVGQLEQSLLDVIPYINNNVKIILLQNGYGIKEKAIEVFKTANSNIKIDNIYTGIVAMGATFDEPGIIKFWGGNIKFQSGLDDLNYIFTNTNKNYNGFIETIIRKSIKKDTWMKLIINSIVNPLSVILKGKNNFIAEKRFNSLKQPLLDEGIEVALSDGIDLSYLTVEQVNKFIDTNNITSMYQDFLKKKVNEIDFINGKIIEVGKKNDIDVTNNIMIYNIVKSLEEINCGK